MYKRIVLSLLLILLYFPLYANHIFGGELLYKHISGNTYNVSLTIYGDCGSNSQTAFNALYNARPAVLIYRNSRYITTINLEVEEAGTEVSPICTAEANNTTCRNGIYPGVRRFKYSLDYTVADEALEWKFLFAGEFSNNSQAGRSSNITNIQGVGGQLMYIEATLNNTAGPNSCPEFTTIPTPFYCINQQQNYNQGAVDADNDSLAFSLTPALISATNSVTYANGYSATQPLATSSGVAFDPVTGQMDFTPNLIQNSLVVNKLSEYRNGVLVGTCKREMTFVVLSNCSNIPINNTEPVNIQDGFATNGQTVVTCNAVNFEIRPTVSSNAAISVTTSGNLPYPVTVSGQNTPTPVISVNIPSTPALPSFYNLYVNYRIDACPLPVLRTIAYTIKRVTEPIVAATVLSPTNCAGKAAVRFSVVLSNGANAYDAPLTIFVRQNGNLVRQFNDITGVFIDSLDPGSYTINAAYTALQCTGINQNLVVVDSGTYPYTPSVTGKTKYCTGDAPETLTVNATPGASVNWYSSDGTALDAAPAVNTTTAGSYKYYISQTYRVCPSAKDSVIINVTNKPTADLLITTPEICLNDTARFTSASQTGNGEISYYWDMDNPQSSAQTGNNSFISTWATSGIKNIYFSVGENGCYSDTIHKIVLVKDVPNVHFAAENICLNDSLLLSNNSANPGTTIYTWDLDGGTSNVVNNSNAYIRWSFSGEKTIKLVASNLGCMDSASQTITVYPFPDVRILNDSGKVCYAEQIFLKAIGGDKQYWEPADKLLYEPDSSIYVRVMEPTTYTVYASNEFGCLDAASITYKDIEQCCTFSYPNAFTPNGDGKNDKFSIPAYGVMYTYSLSIFNRWGQRVFWTEDPNVKWDGNFRGVPCEVGTYFYHFKAKCMIGKDEEHKGEIILMR